MVDGAVGLGAWTSFPGLVGDSMTDGGLLFNPAVRYQRQLRRGRSLHLVAGPGFVDSSDAPVRFVFLPYAGVLYGMQAAGNRKFGLRVGARFVGYGLHLVAVLGFTAD